MKRRHGPLGRKDKFNNIHLTRLEKFLRLIEEDAKCVINKVKYDSYYDFKVDDINTLIYNLCKNDNNKS